MPTPETCLCLVVVSDYHYVCCSGNVFFVGGSSHDKLPELAHQKALEKSLGIKDQSCPVLRLSQKTVWLRT